MVIERRPPAVLSQQSKSSIPKTGRRSLQPIINLHSKTVRSSKRSHVELGRLLAELASPNLLDSFARRLVTKCRAPSPQHKATERMHNCRISLDPPTKLPSQE
eukprot:6437725-Amphidinium_carterae.1